MIVTLHTKNPLVGLADRKYRNPGDLKKIEHFKAILFYVLH